MAEIPKTKIPPKKFEKVTLSFVKGKVADEIISFLENGKVALINRNYNGTMPRDGEKWECIILVEKDRKAIVAPQVCLLSQEAAMESKKGQLAQKFNNHNPNGKIEKEQSNPVEKAKVEKVVASNEAKTEQLQECDQQPERTASQELAELENDIKEAVSTTVNPVNKAKSEKTKETKKEKSKK